MCFFMSTFQLLQGRSRKEALHQETNSGKLCRNSYRSFFFFLFFLECICNTMLQHSLDFRKQAEESEGPWVKDRLSLKNTPRYFSSRGEGCSSSPASSFSQGMENELLKKKTSQAASERGRGRESGEKEKREKDLWQSGATWVTTKWQIYKWLMIVKDILRVFTSFGNYIYMTYIIYILYIHI